MQPVTDLFVLAIFVMMAVLLVRSFRPPRDKDQARELEDWLEERLARQADEFDKKLRASQSALADQNYAAIRGVKDAVDGMGAQLTGSQAAAIKSTPKEKPIRVKTSMEPSSVFPAKLTTIAALRVILMTILLSRAKSSCLKKPTRRKRYPITIRPTKQPARVKIASILIPPAFSSALPRFGHRSSSL